MLFKRIQHRGSRQKVLHKFMFMCHVSASTTTASKLALPVQGEL